MYAKTLTCSFVRQMHVSDIRCFRCIYLVYWYLMPARPSSRTSLTVAYTCMVVSLYICVCVAVSVSSVVSVYASLSVCLSVT